MKKGYLNRKSQVTVFVILAIVIVIGVGAFLFLNNNKTNGTNEINAPVSDYVQLCIEKTVNEGLKTIMFQGGYYNSPEKSTEYFFTKIPYYFYLGEVNIPDKKTIENELSEYIQNELPSCTSNLSVFENQGYKVNLEKPAVKTSLGKIINMKIKYPIQVSFEGKTSYLKDFSYSKEFDFDKIYNIINEFSVEHQKNPDFVPIGYLSILAKQNGFSFNLNYISDAEVVYSFIFNDLLNRNESLFYNFAGNYKWETPKPLAKAVQIEPILYQTAYAGKEFNYQVSAKGDNLQFYDYTGLFDIDSNGKIKFTPTAEQSGTYEILIEAEDDSGNSDNSIMTLHIEKITEELNITK
ncbi:Uncharacterised protein [uncultured archaeon]|nr:Uncharacterised protein [uncultured archaeon]